MAYEARLATWPLIPFVMKFLALALLVGGLASNWSVRLGEALMPSFRAELLWLDDTYRIDALYLDHEGADQVIRVRVGQARYIMIKDMVFAPHPLGTANASTLLGNIILIGALLISTVFAWPARRWWVFPFRALAIPPALALLWSLDVPMVLWGAIWSLHVDAFAPDLFSPLLIWCQFLQGGGRFAMTALLGILIGLGTNRLVGFLAPTDA